MGKSTRLKKKRQKDIALADIEKAFNSIPSFTVLLEVLNDVFGTLIDNEKNKPGFGKMVDLLTKQIEIVDQMSSEVKSRKEIYDNRLSEAMKKKEEFINEPIKALNVLQELATLQLDNITYLKGTHPIYNEEFLNALPISQTEEGKETLKEIRSQADSVLDITTDSLRVLQVCSNII